MNWFITVLVLSFVFAVKTADLDVTIEDKCLKENGITRKDYTSLDSDDLDIKVKCTTLCYEREYGWIRETGELNADNVKRDLYDATGNNERSADIIRACTEDIKELKITCNSAHKFKNCINQKLEETQKQNN